MSTVFSEISIVGLRHTHLEQLMMYLSRVEDEKLYYGNQKQFEKRHLEIKKWLQDAIDYSKQDGVIIPKKVQKHFEIVS